MQSRDYIAFSIIGLMVLLTITAAGLAIAYLQKPDNDKNRESHKTLGIAALTFQLVLSILILVTLGSMFIPFVTTKSGRNKKFQMHSSLSFVMLIGMISAITMICTVIGNIMFYISYFDKTKNDKQFNNIATGFQATVPLYVGAIFGVGLMFFSMS